MTTPFPPPADDLGLIQTLGWGEVKAFGYPWHGKWVWDETQQKQVLILDNGQIAPEGIPRLTSGAHLIDVKMPWADPDPQTPPEIEALGGKFWNQALFSPGGTLYGKNVARGGIPAHCLYGAPDGTVWAVSLNILRSTSGGGSVRTTTWVPGRGEPGTLALYMWRVAGPMKRQSGLTVVTVPLSGAQSLIELFPDIVAEAEACFTVEGGISGRPAGGLYCAVDALKDGGRGSRVALPRLDFMDALPAGNRALYCIRVYCDANHTGTWGRFIPIVAALEVTLNGTPGAYSGTGGNDGGISASVTATRSVSSLLRENLVHQVRYQPAAEGLCTADWGDGPAYEGCSVTFVQSEYIDVVHSEVLSECALLAGYVGEEAVFQSMRLTGEFNGKGEGFITRTPGSISFPENGPWHPFTQTEEHTANASMHMSLEFNGEELGRGDVLYTQSAKRVIANALSLRWYSSIVKADTWPYPAEAPYAVLQDDHASQYTSSTQSGPVRLELMESNVSWNWGSYRARSPASIYPTGYPTGGNSYPTIALGVYLAVMTPQSLRVIYNGGGSSSTSSNQALYDGQIITMGTARTPWGAAATSIPSLAVAWCPIRDQLLVTNTASSWV